MGPKEKSKEPIESIYILIQKPAPEQAFARWTYPNKKGVVWLL